MPVAIGHDRAVRAGLAGGNKGHRMLRADRNLMAAYLIAAYATIVGFTDNFVRVIAEQTGLWQFHATRSGLALMLLVAVAGPLGLRLRVVRWRGVIVRSLIHGLAMVIYFGALAFLPVALVAAGLFTAPIFVLLIQTFGMGRPIGLVQVAAALLGFAGVVMVLGPQAFQGASLAALLPVLAGAMYALGNVATREWCAEESAEVLLAGFFAALGVIGCVGMAVLAVVPVDVPAGAAGFVRRGAVWLGPTIWIWTAVQAAGSLLGVGLMIRAYQITSAARASVFEYIILPASAVWGWLIWGEVLGPLALSGMALIALAGMVLAVRR